MNLSTESLARSSSRRPWTTIIVWVVTLVAAFGLSGVLLADGLTTEFTYLNNPDSKKGDELLEDRFRGPRRVSEIVVVRSEELTVNDPQFEAKVQNLFFDITALGSDVVETAVNYYITGSDGQVSPDKRATIIPVTMAGSFDDATKNVEKVMEIVEEHNGEDGFTTLIAGEASVSVESNHLAERDLLVGESIGATVAIIILALVFGAVVAAAVPLILAIFAIAIAIGSAALVGQVFQLSFFVTNMITMIGLAVGIDYTLFIVSRYREERRKGLEKYDAIAKAGSTATRAVFFSGLTVVLALIGMVIIPTNIFVSLGVGAILVVIVAVLASLTLLPAVLGLLGDRINRLSLPWARQNLNTAQNERDEVTGGFWNWVTRTVMGRPVISLIVTAGLLIAAAWPVFNLNTGFNGVETMPDRLQTKEAFLLLEEHFSFGVVSPLEIVVDASFDDPGVGDAIAGLGVELANDPRFVGEGNIQKNLDNDLVLISVPVAGQPAGELAEAATRQLRDVYVPRNFDGLGVDVFVTGAPAFNVDFYDVANRFTPIVFAVVLGLSFILLMMVFRSIVVPVKAIIMNLLSVGAAYGLMVLVFQEGVGATLFGFQETPVIDAWIPLFLFSVLFGLSMDYHVFLLSRIRERYDQSRNNAESVAYGLRSTASIITGAALIMVAVFGGFAMGELVMFQQVGFGLAVAVFLDATIIRSVLVPASMRLLGDANWYFPKVLSWLPDVRVEAEEPTPTTTAPATGD